MENSQLFTVKAIENNEMPESSQQYVLSSTKRNKTIGLFWDKQIVDLFRESLDKRFEELLEDHTAILDNVAKVVDQSSEIRAGDIFIDIQDDDTLRQSTPWEVYILGDQTLEGDTFLLGAFCFEKTAEFFVEWAKNSTAVEDIKFKMFSHRDEVFTIGKNKFITRKDWEKKFPHLKKYQVIRAVN